MSSRRAKFSAHSDEEMCGATMLWGDRQQAVACARTHGHPGEHIAMACDAGEADGVRWCCRVVIGLPHAEWCVIKGMQERSATL
jgi:hypothetical protein